MTSDWLYELQEMPLYREINVSTPAEDIDDEKTTSN